MTFDLYIFCMALGFFGLFAMLALGFGHGGHGGHLHDHGGGAAHSGASHGGHAASHHAGTNHGGWGRETLLMLLAPRVWFSLLFGFGAIGCLLQRWMSGPLLIAAALVAAYFLALFALNVEQYRFFAHRSRMDRQYP